jgi:tRNA 2-thiocytidine biosynthesis protein TtcA
MSQRQYDRVPDSGRAAEAPRSPAAMLRRALSKQMTRTIAGYGLLAAGDHVMVAVSGGKDSYTCSICCGTRKPARPSSSRSWRCTSTRPSPATTAAAAQWLEDFGGRIRILREDTYS